MLYNAVWAKKNFVAFRQHPHICSPKVCAWNFFQEKNLHPEGLIFGYFWLQKWIPRPKKKLWY